MKVTIVDITDQDLWDGALVRNKKTKQVKKIKILPPGVTISEAVSQNKFNIVTNIDLETVKNNPSKFELIEDEEYAWQKLANSFGVFAWGKIIPTEINQLAAFFKCYVDEIAKDKFEIKIKE